MAGPVGSICISKHGTHFFRMKIHPRNNPRYLRIFTISILNLAFVLLNFYLVKSQSQDLGHIIPISINQTGEFDLGDSTHPMISSDGRFIAYLSKEANPVSEGESFTYNLYLHDLNINKTTTISENVDKFRMSSNGRIFVISPRGGSKPDYLLDTLTNNRVDIGKNPMNGKSVPNVRINDLSNDGRYSLLIASKDLSINPIKKSEGDAIFIYERYKTQLLEIPLDNLRINSTSSNPYPSISGDGRIVVFQAFQLDQNISKETPVIFIYNRVLDEKTPVNIPMLESGFFNQITAVDISNAGSLLALVLSNPGHETGNLFLFDLNENPDKQVYTLENISRGVALSGNGNHIVIAKPTTSGQNILFRYDLTTAEMNEIDRGILGADFDISADGSRIVYTKMIDGVSQVMLWQESTTSDPVFTVSGRITDSTGFPLALVSMESESGLKTTTDQDGYFWMPGIKPGSTKLTPSKEGFEFKPPSQSIEVDEDITGINFTYTHKKLLDEAQKDLGMPYHWIRGSNGPFHGYQAGYCTDLILDAFSWGLNFNIQYALEMDYKAHPWHFYRWRDARDAHDMWRYFSYSAQIHPHQDPYLPGDIVFFDWTLDGEIDHVALVSKVDVYNRPEMLLDATGKIDSNPSGLTSELEWEIFHENTVRGFAHWVGLFEPTVSGLPQGEYLQFAVGADSIDLFLMDETGAKLSSQDNEMIGGVYFNFHYEKSISIGDAFSTNNHFLLVLANLSNETKFYKFTAQFLKNGLVLDRVEIEGSLSNKEIKSIPILLQLDQEKEVDLIIVNHSRRVEGELP